MLPIGQPPTFAVTSHGCCVIANRLALIVLLVGLCAVTFSAQVRRVRVITNRSPVVASDRISPVAYVDAGAELVLVSEQGNWIEVLLPGINPRRETGFIARANLAPPFGAPTPAVTPRAEAPPETPQAPPPAPVQQPPPTPRTDTERPRPVSARNRAIPRAMLSLDGGYRVLSTNFQGGETFRVAGENGESHTSYSIKPGPMMAATLGYMSSSNVGVTVGISRFARATPGNLVASIPNPFFFGQPRSISADVAGLKQEELAVHAGGRGSFDLGRHFRIAVFGGPTLFRIKQSIVTDFTYRESYPYLEASFGAAETVSETKMKFGFNVGGDGAFFFSRRIGVGIGGMFSRATVEFTTPTGSPVVMKAGGAQINAGMRIRW